MDEIDDSVMGYIYKIEDGTNLYWRELGLGTTADITDAHKYSKDYARSLGVGDEGRGRYGLYFLEAPIEEPTEKSTEELSEEPLCDYIEDFLEL